MITNDKTLNGKTVIISKLWKQNDKRRDLPSASIASQKRVNFRIANSLQSGALIIN